MLEKDFQAKLIQLVKERFPNSIVLKNDPNYLQGFPDLLILHGKTWAALEVKRNADSKKRPNQYYYIGLANSMSYASFVYPENLERVLDEIQRAFEIER